MSSRTAAGLGWGLTALSAALFAASVWLGMTREPIAALGETTAAAQDLVFLGAFVVYAAAGAVIVSHQPRNPVGWVFVGLGLSSSLNGFVFEYAVRAVFVAPGKLPFGPTAMWVGSLLWTSNVISLVLLVLLFPDGRLRWRISRMLVWATLAAAAGLITAAVLLWEHRGPALLAEDPVPGGQASALAEASILALFAVVLLAVAVSIARFIRARGEERLQLKWFAFAVGLVAADFLVSELDLVTYPILPFLDLVAILSIPVAVAIAVLKYRLYDIDLVINKTLVYALLAGFITAVYVGVVVGIGNLLGTRDEPSLALSIAATALVAVLFQPVRARIQAFANRLVYGKRASPYELLSRFSERVAGSYAAEDVLERTARVVAEGTGARVGGVWLRVGHELRPAAAWPPEADLGPPVSLDDGELPSLEDAGRAFAVREGDQLLGALTVAKAPGDPFRPDEERLTEDLAAQAGLVLRNVRLTAELQRRVDEVSHRAEDLRASRRRIVAAQDLERRRLERNLHDGAQQHLVALAVNLNLAAALAGKDPDRAREAISGLQRATEETVATLQSLSRGLFPPLLETEGLGPALRAQVATASVPVDVDDAGVPLLPVEVSGAAYFCVLEAVQNSVKYAEASRVAIRLSMDGDGLRFAVEDDGRGFDPATTPRGAGLQNIADRLAVLGGSVDVTSAPGRGTTLSGRVPLRDREPVG